MREFLDRLQWRLVGPHRAGRVVAVAGHPQDRSTFYFGSTGGGVWSTTDAGATWKNVSDGFFQRASVGAIALAPSEPNVIYVGMGEACIRNSTSHGDGVWRSVDGGLSWSHLGLEATRHIARVRVHPQDPETVYVAALGHANGPNPERGIYRSQDGGTSWELVLHRGEDAGAADLAIDPRNPRILYATFWEARRLPWRMDSGGPGSGLWRSTDGGTTWEDLSRRPGLPKGVLGRIGVAPSGARPGRVWSIVEADDGAVFRSDDYGEHWQRLSEQEDLRHRAWYYSHIFADPSDAETVWVLNLDCWRSSDGGKTFSGVPVQHGDCHDLWIDPEDTRRMILGDDGGANVTLDGAESWSTPYNQPTAELYHVTTDTRQPYRIYAAQQDNTTIAFDSQSRYGAITQLDTYEVGGGESGYIAVRPDAPDIVYAGSYKGMITRYDQSSGERRPINVWPEEAAGADDARYRFNWTSPILLSPHDPQVLYQAGNRVFRSTDEGQTWEPVSPDLTYADPDKLRSSGGLTTDNSGAEFYCTIFALVESPLARGQLWAGTDDGRVHLTRDGGASWTEITPPDLPRWATVRMIDASTYEAGTAYVAAEAHKLDDFRPYLWRTRDFGATWERLDRGLADNEYCHVLREDPVRRGLLYCGTELGLHVSFDAGATWQRCRGELPQVPVHDLVLKDTDLVVATHGRSIWILEDLAALRQYQPEQAAGALRLYQPRRQVRWFTNRGIPAKGEARRSYALLGPVVVPYDKRQLPGRTEIVDEPVGAGRNPAAGVAVLYELQDPGDAELKLTFLDAAGEEIRSLVARPGDEDRKPEKGKPQDPVPPRRPGLNRFLWDGRHGRGTQIEIDPPDDESSIANPGPLVAPGRYRVRVELSGQQDQAEFEIASDPRLTAGDQEVRLQYETGLRIWRLLSDLYDGVNRARAARKRLGESEDGKEVAQALQEVESELVAEGGGKRSLYITRAGLDTRLVQLRTVVAAAPPTASARELTDELDRQVAAALGRLTPLLERAEELERRTRTGA
ncbi:MAG: glycosyl hydrolase [Candidatus Dormiibacterota bacterium]